MHSTLYKQLKVYVDDILNKDGYYKKIQKNNHRIYIAFISLFIVYITFILILISKNLTLLSINLFIVTICVLITGYNLLRIIFKFSFKKPHIVAKYKSKSVLEKEVVSKMKLNQQIKKTLNETFKNADDKNDAKHILLNETKINNDKKLMSIIVKLIYYFLTSLIAVILTAINDNFIKICIVVMAIVLIIYISTFSIFYIDSFRFSDEVLGTYIKDYIMNY